MRVGMSNKNKSLKQARGLENEMFSRLISEATHNFRTAAIYYSGFNIESLEEVRCVNKLEKSKRFTNSRKNSLIFFNTLLW